MKENRAFLGELGFSEKELSLYMLKCFDENFDFLADYSDNVILNLKYLQDSFNENLLLKFLIHYPQTFIMDPDLFKERFDLLKSEFPYSYDEIVEKQYWGYEGIDGTFGNGEDIPAPKWKFVPFLMSMAKDDEHVQKAIESLKHPRTRIYKFVEIFNWQGELDITVEDIADEDWLLDIEVYKWDILNNIEYLKKKKLPSDIIEDILYFCPHILMGSTMEVESVLVEHFGENYAQTMPEKADEGNWGDILYGLN